MADLTAGRELNERVALEVMGDVKLEKVVIVGVPSHPRTLRWKSRDELLEDAPDGVSGFDAQMTPRRINEPKPETDR